MDVVWAFCYLSVLIGLSGYGLHRYFIVYLFLKNRKRIPQPLSHFEQLPVITVQLPLFNEIYVVERLLKSVSELDYPRELLQIQVLDDSTDETKEATAARACQLREHGIFLGRQMDFVAALHDATVKQVDAEALDFDRLLVSRTRPARSRPDWARRGATSFASSTPISSRTPHCSGQPFIFSPIQRSE